MFIMLLFGVFILIKTLFIYIQIDNYIPFKLFLLG